MPGTSVPEECGGPSLLLDFTWRGPEKAEPGRRRVLRHPCGIPPPDTSLTAPPSPPLGQLRSSSPPPPLSSTDTPQQTTLDTHTQTRHREDCSHPDPLLRPRHPSPEEHRSLPSYPLSPRAPRSLAPPVSQAQFTQRPPRPLRHRHAVTFARHVTRLLSHPPISQLISRQIHLPS